jgi:predicted nuclease with TOPRIM domain
MTSATLTEIAKARAHDEWLQLKLSELESEYQNLLEDHHRLVKDNSKLRTTINQLRAGLE